MNIQFNYRCSILIRFSLYFFISAAGVIAALTLLEFQKFKLERSRQQGQESLRLSLTSRALQTDLLEPVSDMRTIAALQDLRDYVQQETAENRARLEREFVNFAQHIRIYDQIRYIDSSGIERVRVNFDGQVATPVSPDQLQDKSNRYYVQKTLQLNANSVFISPLDLNIEEGRIERPFKPMIRFAVPVFNTRGQLRGMVVLNYLAAMLLDDFREFMADSWGEPAMVNSQGYWLSSTKPEQEWGFMLGRDETFVNQYPAAWSSIVSRESGEVETTEGLFLFQTVRPYIFSAVMAPVEEHLAEQYWKIISRISPQALAYSPLSLLETRYRALTSLLLLVGILSLALAWLRTNYEINNKALRKSERWLAEAQRVAHLGNWVWDISTGKLNWSDQTYRIFGRQPQEFDASYDAFLASIHPADRDKVIEAVNATLRHNVPYAIDHRIVLPDGTVRHVHERGELRSNAGEPVSMLGTVQDITERVRTEQELRENEQRFRQLADNINEVFWLTEWPQNRVLYVSPAFERIWGIAAERIYQDPMVWINTIVEEDRPGVEQTFLECSAKGSFDVIYQILRPDGETRWIHDRAFVVRNEQGDVFRIAGIAQDITERKQFEHALRESEERFRELIQQAPDGIFTADLNGMYTDVNAAGCNMLGFTRDEIVGKTIVEFIPLEYVERLWREKEQLIGGAVSVSEWSLRRKDGSYLPVEVSARILPDDRWQGFVRDISERKRAEKRLRQAATVFDTTTEAIVIADADGKILTVNQAYTHITGFEPEETIGKDLQLHQAAGHDGQVSRQFWQSLKNSGHWQGEIMKQRKNGESYPAWENISVVKDDQGRITNYVSVTSDISSIKQAENELKAAQANLTAAQRIAHLGSWEMDVVSGETYWSDEFFRICGLQPQSVRPSIEFGLSLVHPEDRDRVEKAIKQAIDENQEYRIKKRIIRPDGSIRYVIAEGEVIRNDNGESSKVIGSFLDVTEQELAEQQLQQYREQLEDMVAQRTAALQASYEELESFSYSIAHDLRTPLRAITSFSQILREEAGPKLDEPQRQDLGRIVTAGKYMARLIDDILELVRISRANFVMETVNLSSIARSVSEHFRQTDPGRSVRVDIEPHLVCKGDGWLLRIVLENLLANAWKYTSKRSNAHIEFGALHNDTETVYYVRDNGAGFDIRYIDKLFKPFQRLHTPGEFEGTGIGLASVRSAVQRHNGKVWAESKVGKGATFYFTLGAYRSGA